MSELLIKSESVRKSFAVGDGHLEILKGIDLEINKGEAISIVGGSGAGKSTLLHILGGLDTPNSGKVFFNGEDVYKMPDEDLALFRNSNMGFVFQFHHLLSEFTALENVMMPAQIAGISIDESSKKAKELLSDLGLDHRFDHFPSQLSGGEQQRVAIARSLIREPQVLFADEPTGNLDSENARHIHDLFFKLQKARNLALVVVTHELPFAARFPISKTIKDGQWVDL